MKRMKVACSLHVLILATAILHLGCGGVRAAEDEAKAATVPGEVASRFHFSTEAEEQILRLRAESAGEVAPSYRLFGDGRLMREILFMGNHKPVHSAELYLSHDDMVSLFELLVTGDLPEMTPDGLRAKNGGKRLPGFKDGGVTILELNLLSYRSSNGTEISPFTTQVRMLTPLYVVEKIPDLREARAIVALEEALDAYFATSAREVIRTELRDKSFTWKEDDDL